MISTGQELEALITALNADAAINADLLDVFVDNAKTILEEERPWMVLRKTDSSKTVATSNTWQTAIDLSTITDFAAFHGESPIRLFDGDTLKEYYVQRPIDRRLEYKDVSGTFVYDANGKLLYLNGLVAFAGTLWINYLATTPAIDLDSTSAVWTTFPSRFLPLLAFYAVGVFKGAVDYDDINKMMLEPNNAAYRALHNAMTAWDDRLQHAEIEQNDPTELAEYPRARAINIHDS